jgi:MFS family permease
MSAPTPAPPATDAPLAPSTTAWNRNIVGLGLTSLFTDVSTEMLIPVLPLFITGTLHASASSLGIIEGVAESTASLLRLSSGWLSDRVGRRKPFLVFGYAISTVAKAAFALASTWPAVLAMRFTDRVGKGLRNPPRDALIADSVTPDQRGKAYGLHRALDTTGAVIGPLVAFAMLNAWPGNYRRIFIASALPGALALLVLGLVVRSRRRAPTPSRPLAQTVRSLGTPFRRFVMADAVFQLGNSSMAFVLLRAKTGSTFEGFVPLVYVLYNAVYAGLALPLGAVSDRIGRRRLILAAYALYAVAYGVLGWSGAPAAAIAAMALLGVQSALIEGAHRSLIADFVSSENRGTAFGIYHTVVGLALLPASILAGGLWDRFGARATFLTDAALAAAAALLFALLLPARDENRDRYAATA